MNLPLHFGLFGSLEAGLIAWLVGIVVFALGQHVRRHGDLSHGQLLGAACLVAIGIAAGCDLWNLFYTSTVRLESPLYARLALAGIHDPDQLGTRVVLEVAGALAGVALGRYLFSARSKKNDQDNGP